MQQFTTSPMTMPAPAQHQLGFPAPGATAAAGAPPSPVRGGGGVQTVARVRWGRVLPLLAGAALLAFGTWAYATQSGGSSGDEARSVSGGGSVALADAPASAETAQAVAPLAASDASKSAATKAPAKRSARATRRAKAAAKARRAKAAKARRAAAASTVAIGGGASAATAAPGATAGSGTAASGELPLTGIETWIAGGIGVLLLVLGILVQFNAVRIAATAMLYRRGILLRPVDCARLAQSRGLPRLRVWISNVLHRLLEEPRHDGGFVAARISH